MEVLELHISANGPVVRNARSKRNCGGSTRLRCAVENERGTMNCRVCRSNDCERVERRGPLDYLFGAFALQPWSCRNCERRFYAVRSEERRVGKECRARRWGCD